MKIGTLAPSPGTSAVRWHDGKRQIRALLKGAGIKPKGTFRPRRENGREFVLSIPGGHVTAARAPNSPVTVEKVQVTAGADLDPELLAAILAQG
jgi:hypothetical protein